MSWLQDQLHHNPNGLYIEYGSRQYSYFEIDKMVQLYAQSILRENIQIQNRILIYLPSGIGLIEIIHACFEVGAVAVPISLNLTEIERNVIIETIQPNLIITNWRYHLEISSYSIPVVPIEELPNSSRGCSSAKNNYIQKEDDIAAIILTSGTTGIPKAVQLTYGNFETSCANWNGFLQFNKSIDQFLCCLPLHHIGGLAVLIRALIYGFSVNLITQFNAGIILKAIQSHPVSIISLVPTMLKRILEFEGGLGALKSLRWILLGGGPSPEFLLDTCIKEKLNIVKVYGMTETCSGTVGLKLLDEPQNKLYAGRPLPGAKIWTENEELNISGPMVMKGYVSEEDSGGIHNSHDLGWVDDGDLIFLDIRRKDLIISGGENINPIEVEEALINIKGITDAAVIGIEDEEWGQKVTAFIVQKKDIIETDMIYNKLKKYLSSYKIPKNIIEVPSIPRNELGKIEYNRLVEFQL